MAGIGEAEVARITVPHRMMRRIEKQRLRRSEPEPFWSKKPVIITCKQKKFNHHIGQTYRNLTVKDLASGGWKHRKSKSDYFTINAYKSVSLTLLHLLVIFDFFCTFNQF